MKNNLYMIVHILDADDPTDGIMGLWPECAKGRAFPQALRDCTFAESIGEGGYTKEQAEEAFSALTDIPRYLEISKAADSSGLLFPVALLEIKEPTFNTGNEADGTTVVFPDNSEEIDRFAPGLILDGDEVFDALDIKDYTNSAMAEAHGREFYLFADSDTAGEAAAERWRDMAENDPKEFVCIIGEERLVQWAMGQSDSFGISGLDDFLEITAKHPEEEFGSYDPSELDVDGVSQEVIDALGFTPTVAYRCN